MNECAFCETGVRPFYDLDISGIKQLICHTCFHTGKHKQAVRPTEQSTAAKSPPVQEKSGTSKRQ
jgi:hypothetical protein